jgi:hypothetical protein
MHTTTYYLVDSIYRDWATLVEPDCNLTTEKTKRFAQRQESCRKDVVLAFGVLQDKWAIPCHPTRTLNVQTMHEVMPACVVMHNMIIKQ